MATCVSGATIRRLREEKNITQAELAEKLGVSSEAVSEWETNFLDIMLAGSLASALGVSAAELMCGNTAENKNVSCNMLRLKFYVCPVCGNIITSTGDAVISCCGITLPALKAEEADTDHLPGIERVEDEFFVTVPHEMTKTHYISFLAYVNADTARVVKLYPEGNAEARFHFRGRGCLYAYCNKHGLKKYDIKRNI